LMPVATANRIEPNKSRRGGSTSVKMDESFLLLLSGVSWDVFARRRREWRTGAPLDRLMRLVRRIGRLPPPNDPRMEKER